MMQRYKTAALSTAAVILLTFPAIAKADTTDHSAWFNVTASGPVNGGKLLGWAEVQGRFGEDVSRLSQSIIRPGIGWQVSKTLQVYGGYGRITNHNPGRDVGEDRAWQQLSWSGARLAGGVISSRTRLEQRWVETGDDTGWRLRHWMKFNRPVRPGADLALVVTSEAFFALNDTDWGARGGFDQLRTFAGVGFTVAPKARLEIGYMNQFINRAGPNDRMNHIASTNLFVRF